MQKFGIITFKKIKFGINPQSVVDSLLEVGKNYFDSEEIRDQVFATLDTDNEASQVIYKKISITVD